MKSVDSKQRTGVVRWLQPNETFENPPKFVSEEVISVYEVVEHPHYNFCLGDVVMHVTTSQPKFKEEEFDVQSKKGYYYIHFIQI